MHGIELAIAWCIFPNSSLSQKLPISINVTSGRRSDHSDARMRPSGPLIAMTMSPDLYLKEISSIPQNEKIMGHQSVRERFCLQYLCKNCSLLKVLYDKSSDCLRALYATELRGNGSKATLAPSPTTTWTPRFWSVTAFERTLINSFLHQM